jgi:hypothetical protein
MCASTRGPPEYRKQRIPAATPHVAQATEENCFVVNPFFFIPTHCHIASRNLSRFEHSLIAIHPESE